MKAFLFVLIASLFASEFHDVEEDELRLGKIVKKVLPKVLPKIPKIGPIVAPFLLDEDGEEELKFNVKLEVHNEDMFAPEFDEIDDELKIKIGSIIKKILPVVVPKIPHIGPIIAPFLSEEDMEPEVIEYDEDELAELVLAELAEEYEIDAGFWKKIGGFIKRIAPTVIKTFVPKIPHVGPIIAPFLGEEDSGELDETVIGDRRCKTPYGIWNEPLKKCIIRPGLIGPVPRKPRKPIKPSDAGEPDEIKFGKLFKKLLPKILPKIPKIGPIVAPFLGEEDTESVEVSAELEENIIGLFAEELMLEGYELDESFWKKIGSWLKPHIPQIIRTLVPKIPHIGPIIEPFLGEEDQRIIYRKCPDWHEYDSTKRACVHYSQYLFDSRCPRGKKWINAYQRCEHPYFK